LRTISQLKIAYVGVSSSRESRKQRSFEKLAYILTQPNINISLLNFVL